MFLCQLLVHPKCENLQRTYSGVNRQLVTCSFVFETSKFFHMTPDRHMTHLEFDEILAF